MLKHMYGLFARENRMVPVANTERTPGKWPEQIAKWNWELLGTCERDG
jgi:hypothetical protein